MFFSVTKRTDFHRITSLRPNLRLSVYEAGSYGLMVGIGESYLAAFAIAIGLGEVFSGIATSVPMLCGGVLQFLSIYALSWVGSYKRWMVVSVAAQALIYGPLIYAALVGSISAWFFFGLISCYWGFGLAAAPAWNAWISHIVPNPIRSRYFAGRTRVIQLAMFVGFLGGGWFLGVVDDYGYVLTGFATVFAIAGFARLSSAFLLYLHQTSVEDDFAPPRQYSVWNSWLSVSPKARWLIIYLVGMQACIWLSGPYFVPFMMKKLGYSYEAFVSVLASALVARILSMSLWGMVARKYGSQTLLWIGGLGLIPLSSMWIVSDAFYWLVAIQVLAGFLWSAYELALFLMFLDYIPQRRRADILTIYYLANSMASCVGAMTGGWWIAYTGTSVASYHQVYLISSFGRVACTFFLWWMWRSSATPSRPEPEDEVRSIGPSASLRSGDSDPDSDAAPSVAPIVDQARRAA
jgi:MFS family permease